MNKYNSEDYLSVIEKRTGRKIVDCADEMDALLMVSFDPQNRMIIKNKFLMGPVIDIETPNALPTTDIVVNVDGGVCGSWKVHEPEKLPQIKLPEGQGKPVIV